jgi:hypothetical protein
MDTWDNAQPDRDPPIGDASALPERGSEGVSEGVPKGAPEAVTEAGAGALDLRQALAAIANHYSVAPQADLLPKVMARATRLRRRRHLVRAASATAVLVVAALLGPSMASELGMHGGDASAAPPPSAIVDLTSAYPVPQDSPSGEAVAMPTAPENALMWPSRGAAMPAQAVGVAKTYLLDHVKPAASGTTPTTTPTTAAMTTATVTTLWAQVDEDTKAAPQQKVRETWLYVMQGWTNGPDGSPSQAQLMVGDYTQTAKASSMSVYATPVKFTHVRPGSADDADDTRQIAELSVFLPQSDRLVVLGAPQTKTVLYAKTGGDLIPQKTTDGVAVFPRTRELVKGHYADTIQVRDAKNVALTPPDAWNAADFALSGAMSLWSSAGVGWEIVPPRGVKPSTGPNGAIGTVPSVVPQAESSTEPTVVAPRGRATGSSAAPAPPSEDPGMPS